MDFTSYRYALSQLKCHLIHDLHRIFDRLKKLVTSLSFGIVVEMLIILVVTHIIVWEVIQFDSNDPMIIIVIFIGVTVVFVIAYCMMWFKSYFDEHRGIEEEEVWRF